MNNKKTIWLTIGCVGAILIISLLCKYGCIITDPEIMTLYADVITPILALINIAVLVSLTVIVSNSDGKRSKQNIEAQKIIMISQMRHQAVLELAKYREIAVDINVPRTEIARRLDDLSIKLDLFKIKTEYIFEELFTEDFIHKYFHALIECLNNLVECSRYPFPYKNEEINLYMYIEKSSDKSISKILSIIIKFSFLTPELK